MNEDGRTPQAEEPERLAKRVAAQLRCSRREAEQYVDEGWVRVDGEVVDVPQFRVAAAQSIEVDAQARLQPPVSATFLLHQPAGCAGAQAQALLLPPERWTGDASGIRRSRSHGVGLTELLALPPQASGLAVFSQDWRVVRKLTEDAAFVEQELVAEVAGTIAPDGLARLCQGLVRDGRPLPPARVSWQSEKRLRFACKGIPPAWVPWMCAQVGLEVTALRRLRIGRLPLAGLPAGQWRYLGPGERF